MSPAAEQPFGSWATPVTSELVVRAAHLPGAVAVDGSVVWWSESRPGEGGRTALRRRLPDGSVDDVLPAPWNVRTGVHEYGGGAWWVRDGVLWFVDWSSQRLHRLDAGGTDPVPLTPEPAVPRGLRYADGDVHPEGAVLAVVRETHPAQGGVAGVRNEIVLLDAHEPSGAGDSGVEVVVTGPDFVSDPRWSPDAASLSWLEWDHPDMPWDATRLSVRDLASGEDRVVAGGPGESVCQPRWAADGSLWFSSDRTGFWSLYRWLPGTGAVETMVDLGLDIGFPQWVFGQSCFAHLGDGRTTFAYRRAGLDHLAVRRADGSVVDLDVPHTAVDSLTAQETSAVYIAASPVLEPHVVAVAVDDDDRALAPDLVAPPRDLGLDQQWFSVPEPVTFPTGDGSSAHGLLYRPTNPEATPPPGERPPLLVLIHGGPTSAARPMLKLSTQYWTSRGFAVVDVNYRGSTGYGRAYRDLLRGRWGVADVEDCVAVARHLAAEGVVDPVRCCIRGGSAGGFTTLAALAFHDAFAAGASHYGVADLETLARDTHKFESRYLDGLVAPYPEGRDTYVERSPIHHVDGIDRPLAVFQGLEDAIVPPNQSEAIVAALRQRGVPVAYVAFAGEQHGFRQAASIRRALDGELSFYAQVLGFALPAAEAIDPVEVAGLG